MSKVLESFEQKLQQELASVVVGMQPVVRALAIAVIARGHVLLQGAPGLGKTLLSKSLAGVLGGVFKRVQGTSDLMPADITGVHVFDADRKDFVFRHGPVGKGIRTPAPLDQLVDGMVGSSLLVRIHLAPRGLRMAFCSRAYSSSPARQRL